MVKKRINAVIIRIKDLLGKYIEEMSIEWDGNGVDLRFVMWIFENRKIRVIIRKEYREAKSSGLLGMMELGLRAEKYEKITNIPPM